jgi:hypothetical protein
MEHLAAVIFFLAICRQNAIAKKALRHAL